MSLLLDALKRAEEAKKAQSDANDATPTSDNEALSLAPLDEQLSSGVSENEVPPPLMTRDRLPNISQSMSILPEDFSEPLQRKERRERPEQPGSREPARLHTQRPSLTPPQADRDTARQLFEAKTSDYDPRRPFYIVLGALGVFAIGAGLYFWYQLQPASMSRPVAAPIQAAIAQVPEARGFVNAESVRGYGAATDPYEAAAFQNADAASAFAAPETPQRSASYRATAMPVEAHETPAAPTPQSFERVTLIKTPPQGPSAVELGYAAFEGGDLVAAKTNYDSALAQDPLNRDALLGLAAIDMRQHNYASAEARYVKLLEIDPRDPYGHAGLIGLNGRTDPVATESRIKNLLAQRPDANVLHFTLGNQFAMQGRWPEAQQAYFKAYSTDPSNPDYAFNLAVSLDQLRQDKLALEYYEKALSLSRTRPAAFLASQAETRLRELNH